MFTRYFSSNRKILFLSFLTGLFTALLLGALQFTGVTTSETSDSIPLLPI